MRLLLAASAVALLLSSSALAQSAGSSGDKAKSLGAIHSEALMVYLNPEALHAMRSTSSASIDDAVGEARSASPPAAPRRRR